MRAMLRALPAKPARRTLPGDLPRGSKEPQDQVASHDPGQRPNQSDLGRRATARSLVPLDIGRKAETSRDLLLPLIQAQKRDLFRRLRHI